MRPNVVEKISCHQKYEIYHLFIYSFIIIIIINIIIIIIIT